MEGFPFVHEQRVRYRDCDAAGHVNNAVYLTYLEEARIAFLAELGLVERVEELRMVVARIEIDYRSSLVFGERFRVGVRRGRSGTTSFALEHEIRTPARLVAEARSVIVAFDYATRKKMEIPDDWRRKLAA